MQSSYLLLIKVHPHPSAVQTHPLCPPPQHWHRALCRTQHASHWGGISKQKHSRIAKVHRDFPPPSICTTFPALAPPSCSLVHHSSSFGMESTYFCLQVLQKFPNIVTRRCKYFQILWPGTPNIVIKFAWQINVSPKVPATVAGRMPSNQISITTCTTGFTLFEIILFLLVVFINSKF